ncbi:putative meiotically up-regulated gene 86 protein [Tirmania nivea]|nr:putative meiotically up-regulated gene 86 protein [Tirmania nivea]
MEKIDLETGFNRARSPPSSKVHEARTVQDRHSAIWVPAWAGSLSQLVEPKEPQFRKFADPAPLGLFSGAFSLIILSLFFLNTRGVSEPSIVVAMAYSYGGFIQVLAGMWEFARGNTLGATVITSCGGFWLSLALIGTPSLGIMAAYKTQSEQNIAMGFFLMSWFLFGILSTLCTLKSNLAFFLLFFFLDLTFLTLSLGHLYQGPDGSVNIVLIHLGGVFGLATSFCCCWNAMAGLVDESNSFFTIPVFPFPWSKEVNKSKT